MLCACSPTLQITLDVLPNTHNKTRAHCACRIQVNKFAKEWKLELKSLKKKAEESTLDEAQFNGFNQKVCLYIVLCIPNCALYPLIIMVAVKHAIPGLMNKGLCTSAQIRSIKSL